MYTLLLANFEALVYRAAGLRADEPEPVDPSFPNLYLRIKQRFPRLRRWRNYLGHPPFLQLEGNEHGWATFDDGVWALLDDGTAESIVDIEIDHLVVRRFVDELIVCLEVDA
ncbi:MAG: hypothetical protein JWN99_97 [Ilumatobacteraceae bacterium]|nr:hypothetical protein [Ilumatobacteraceae bacterium]